MNTLLKQVKGLTLDVLLEVSFQKKKLSDYYAIILVSFLLVWCIAEVVDSQANYKGYRYDVHFLRCHTFTVIHSVNGKEVC